MKTHICQNCNCDERKNLMDGIEFKEALPWHEIKKISFCKKDLRIIIELDNGNSIIVTGKHILHNYRDWETYSS